MIRLCCFAVFLSLIFAPAMAQEPKLDADGVEVRPIVPDKTLEKESIYVEPSIENLSKLYWRISKFTLDDDVAVDNYLRINECDLYNDYRQNEFEWVELREATRQHIKSNATKFPTRFEIMIPIFLGKYNIEREYFDVDPSSNIDNVRNIDAILNVEADNCGGVRIDKYPANLILYLNRPFDLRTLPASRELAELFLVESQSNNASYLSKYRVKDKYLRIAFLNLYVEVNSLKGEVRGAEGLSTGVFAQIDGFDVFADEEKLRLLYSKNFNEQQKAKSVDLTDKEIKERNKVFFDEGPLLQNKNEE